MLLSPAWTKTHSC